MISRLCSCAVIGAPTSLGAFAPGQEQAPRALREAGLVERLGADDRGDIPLRRWRPDREHRHAMNAAGVAEAVREVAELVRAAVRDGLTPIVLGGDCTVGIGTVAGARPAGLVYFDMHPDLNTPGSVPDGALDWMGVAHMLGLPGTVPGLGPHLAPDQVLLFGREPSQTKPGEQEAIERLGIATVDAAAVSTATAAEAARRFDRYLVHFDVDVVDFLDQPLSENTGHNIGLPFATAVDALAALVAGPGFAGLTVTRAQPAARGRGRLDDAGAGDRASARVELSREQADRRAPVLDRGGGRDAVARAGERDAAVQRPLGERVREALRDRGAGADREPFGLAAADARDALVELPRPARRRRGTSRSRGRARAGRRRCGRARGRR